MLYSIVSNHPKVVEVPRPVAKPAQTKVNLYKEDLPQLWDLLERTQIKEISSCESIIENEFLVQAVVPPKLQITEFLNLDYKSLGILRSYQDEPLNRILGGPLTVKYGYPTSISAFGQWMLVGTEKGLLYALNLIEPSNEVTFIDSSGHEHRMRVLELITQPSCLITRVHVDPIEQVVGVGFANGALCFLNWQKPSRQEWSKKCHCSRITVLRNIAPRLWITNEENARVHAHKLEKGIFSFDLNSKMLLEQNVECVAALREDTQLKHFPESRLRNLMSKVPQKEVKDDPYYVVALSSQEKVWIIRIMDYNQAQVLITLESENPQPSICEWVTSTDSVYLFIAWGTSLHHYRLEKCKQEGIQIISFTKTRVDTTQGITFMKCINPNVVAVVDAAGGVGLVTFVQTGVLQLLNSGVVGRFHITHNDQLREIYLYNDGRLTTVKEYTFQQIFQRLIEANEIETCEQLLLLAELVAVDKTKILQRFMEFLSRKIQQFVRLESGREPFLERIITFMVLTHNEELLFTHVFSMVNQFLEDGGKMFETCLQSFIMKGYITYLPKRQLIELIEGLMLHRDLTTLEALLLNLDLERNDQGLVLHYCMENSLFKPLIQLCSGKNDFLTPLFQLFKYSQGESRQYYGIRAIAYIQFCLLDIHPQDAEKMLVWMFERNNLEQLMKIDAYACFQTLTRVFSLTTEQLIEFTHKDNLQLIRDIVIDFNDHNVQRYFTVFIVSMLYKLKLMVSDEVIDATLTWLANNPETLFEIDPQAYFECIDKKVLGVLAKHPIKTESIQVMHQHLLLKLLRTNSDPAQFDQFELVQAHFYTQANQLERAMNVYLGSSNSLIRRGVFMWFSERMAQGQQIMELVLHRLHELIKIDLRGVRQIVQQQSKDYEEAIIEQLAKYPNLQLEYLDFMMRIERAAKRVPDPHISKLHMYLIIKLQPQRLMDELKYNDYPLDEVLRVSQEFNNVEAQAYVHERNGAIDKAIEIHSGLLTRLFDDALNKINHYEEVTSAEFMNVNHKINELLAICQRNTQFDTSEDSWYSVLNLFIQFSKRLDKRDPKQEFVFKELFKKLGYIFEEISLHTSLDIFASQLEERYAQLDVYELRDTFLKILHNFAYQRNFIYNIQTFIKEGLTKAFLSCYSTRAQGYFVSSYCDRCFEPITDEARYPPRMYLCGHQMHEQCIKDQRCWKCQQIDLDIFNAKQRKMRRPDEKPVRSGSIMAPQVLKLSPIKGPPTKQELLKSFDQLRAQKLLQQT